ncbi:SET domain-containing protein [Gloeophyllum trabeum ATCC 11539]|uniref:SET domain-containing protein n=1 Tax=Gloeophyllum trabeum (strain ATCC 11539 / FP-39264 / Madison 617) TaxID=670483 RepID=S7RH21_GLOTA|nr:SET domain-containing protein [Gloeophyllum trabeum ATCC 11539]EPQ53510.1 SET domain-containing protein [Gloeophyllum trabeum ATCC 11539]
MTVLPVPKRSRPDLFYVGTTILTVPPHVHALSTPSLPAYCSRCSAARELKRCTKCRAVWYCSASCQNADWSLHKRECPSLIRWASSAPSSLPIPSDAIRCLGRTLWEIEANGLTSIFTREIASMQSNRPPPTAATQTETHAHLAHALVRYLGVSSPEELTKYGVQGVGGLVDLVARFTTNAITLTTPSLSPIGVIISPLAALFNHSCAPNAVIVFPTHGSSSVNIRVVTLRDLHPGEEVLTAYVDTTLPRRERQQALRETYNFTCTCELCVSEEKEGGEVDPREAVLCPRAGCGGVWRVPEQGPSDDDMEVDSSVANGSQAAAQVTSRCTKCKHLINPVKLHEVSDAVRLGLEGYGEAVRVQNEDPARAYKLTKNLAPLLAGAGLAPSSHPLLGLLRLYQQFELDRLGQALNEIGGGRSSESNVEELRTPGAEKTLGEEEKAHAKEAQEILDDVVRTQARIVRGLSDILVEGHPVRAVALAELGKALSVDEPWPEVPPSPTTGSFPPHLAPRLQLALQTLLRSKRELEIGFGGDGGEVGRDVGEMMRRVEGELSVWREGVRSGGGR